MTDDSSMPRPGEIDRLITELIKGQDADDNETAGDRAGASLDLSSVIRDARLRAGADRLRPRDQSAPSGASSGSTIDGEPDASSDDEFVLTIPGYRDLARINHGAQGALYRGIHERTKRRVAVKVLWGGFMASKAERDRFDRESDLLGELDHPFIVRITDKGRTSTGLSYIVMDFVDGPPLDQYVAARAQLRQHPRALLGLFLKIVEAVEAAHSRKVIHRDLKPSNIRVDQDGNPRVLDFGLARTIDDSPAGSDHTVTATGQFIGSLPWASPEQAQGRHALVDARSDVYALGMILCYMLSGRCPFETTGSHVELLEQIVRGGRRAPSRLADGEEHRVVPPWVDERLDAIVMKAVATDRDARYASAKDFGDAVRSFLDGEYALLVAPRQRTSRMKQLLLATVLIAAMALIIALRPGATNNADPAAPPPPPAAPPIQVVSPGGTHGGSGGNFFSDTGAGPLVGLRVWKGHLSEHVVITGVQPLFRTAEGVVPGNIFGRQTDNMEEEVAKPGFAVGGMRLGWGQRIDGLELRFVPLGDGEPYTGKWMGGKQDYKVIDGQGAAAKGVQGRAGAELDAIGLLFE